MSSSKFFTIIKDYLHQIKKFSLRGRSVEFKIQSVPDKEDPVEWVKEAIEGIVLHAVKDLHPDDQVGFSFCGESFKERGPGWLGFRKACEVKTSDVWEMLMKIYQSNKEALNTETFCLKVTSVRIPTGKGKDRARKYNTFDEECARRRGIVSINNTDHLCLARAIVVGKANAKKDPEYARIRLNRGKLQDIKTEKLLKKAGVVIPETGGGIEELQKFQHHLKKYKITVYVYGTKGREVMFEGYNNEAERRINLLYHRGHYNLVTSLTGAFCCVYYCEECHVPYNSKNDHRCGGQCSCCQQSPPCNREVEVACSDCNRQFRSQQCYDNHKMGRATLCNLIRVCKLCLKTIKKDREHVCGEIYCKLCRVHVPADHQCFMQPDTRKPNGKDTLFVFFDLETRQERKIGNKVFMHEPNLCVAAFRCDHCINEEKLHFCQKCGFRLKIFTGTEEIIRNFMEYMLVMRKKFKKVVCIAHNGQAFDHQFILNYVLTQTDLKPELIMRGTKIILLQVGNIKFLDSLNYFPMKLAALPKAFDLGPELKKGYFPHLFNKRENENYIGSLPALHYYNSDAMMPNEHTAFLTWHEEHKNDTFNMKTELVEYCTSDVDILTKACLKFRGMFLKECNVDPFMEATTIASACNLVYRRNFLKPNTIGLIPKHGYRWRDIQSRIAIQWLLWEEKNRNIYIKHAARGEEAIVGGVKVDGYYDKTAFEFHGCYYHGHICITHRRDDPLHEDPSDTLNSRSQRTALKTERLRSLGYEVVEKWECEFRREMEKNKEIENYTSNHLLLNHVPLTPRDAFYGGRTGATKLYYKVKPAEKVKYIDVCSLYPWVCKYSKFCIRHPEIFVGEQCSQLDLNTTEGFIKCKILPPQDLYHPVLPLKQNNKLMFVLCLTCGDERNPDECLHSVEERALVGTWMMDEVRKAIDKGYKILEVFEVWKYDVVQYDNSTQSGGLFAEMMDTFVKMKQESSGWPAHCKTEELKQQYIDSVYRKEGIRLQTITKNPGLRSLAKLILNSFWGKFGQRENQPKTTIVNEPRELYELLSNPSIEVDHIQPVNDETVVVSWEHKEEAYDPLATVNVCIAAYVTTQARLKLYEYLEQLGDRVLYYDTDSVIYVSREGEPEPETGTSLGEMTDELSEYGPGSYITEFTSGGPKMYAYRVFCPKTNEETTVCKVKGIRINYDAAKKVNFESLRNMIISDSQPVYVTSQNIRRTQDHEVVTKEESKIFRQNFSKRRRIEDYDSVPYGFKRQRL